MKCGFCKYKLKEEATVCGHCQADVEWYNDTQQGLFGMAIVAVCAALLYAKVSTDFSWLFALCIFYLLFNIPRLFTGARVTRNGQTKNCDW